MYIYNVNLALWIIFQTVILLKRLSVNGGMSIHLVWYKSRLEGLSMGLAY